MSKASKTIISVLALAAVIAAGFVFYNERIANQEEPILDSRGNPIEWVKYENKELGFSFEYPKGFILEEEDVSRAGPVGKFRILALLVMYNEKNKRLLMIDVLENPERLSLKDWGMAHDGTDLSFMNKEGVYFNDNQFFVWPPSARVFWNSAFKTNGNNTFQFFRTSDSHGYPESPLGEESVIEKSFVRILETFKAF